MNNKRQAEKREILTAVLPISYKIMKLNWQLDNAAVDYKVIEKGSRVDLVKKNDKFYLRDKNNRISELFYPVKDYDQILEMWSQINENA